MREKIERILKNNSKGSISVFSVMIISGLFILFLVLCIEIPYMFNMNSQMKYVADNAGASAISSLDEDYVSKGKIHIDETEAKDIATDIIRTSLELDENDNPIGGNAINGKVDYEIIVVQTTPGELKTVQTSLGEVDVKNPSVIVAVKVPMKGLLYKFLNYNVSKIAISEAKFSKSN